MAKTERVNIRLTPEMKEKLQKAADAENRTLTNYIENIIINALKKEGWKALLFAYKSFSLFMTAA